MSTVYSYNFVTSADILVSRATMLVTFPTEMLQFQVLDQLETRWSAALNRCSEQVDLVFRPHTDHGSDFTDHARTSSDHLTTTCFQILTTITNHIPTAFTKPTYPPHTDRSTCSLYYRTSVSQGFWFQNVATSSIFPEFSLIEVHCSIWGEQEHPVNYAADTILFWRAIFQGGWFGDVWEQVPVVWDVFVCVEPNDD